ncbi:ftsH [Symbiodinium natans]|uniref:FtsH protein n=1 Tax=Symbiodinium natans TaxID=878477 RepID=A0A812U2I4_9DINO|nr:ftsH [Symbiodinium natans]
MISQFGTLFRAWREGLDPTGRDRLSWGEFTHVFRLPGWASTETSRCGNVMALWEELDTEGIGVLRFSNLDEAFAVSQKAWPMSPKLPSTHRQGPI